MQKKVFSLGWKIPWRRKWQPIPVFLPGKSHGWRSLEGYSPWGRRVGHNWATLQTALTASFPPHSTPTDKTPQQTIPSQSKGPDSFCWSLNSGFQFLASLHTSGNQGTSYFQNNTYKACLLEYLVADCPYVALHDTWCPSPPQVVSIRD